MRERLEHVPMRLETSRFGAIEVDPNAVITFTQPILGFQEYRRFVLLPGPSGLLKWLQSVDSGDLAFIVMDPCAVVPDYKRGVSAHDLAELTAQSADDLEVYTLVVVPQDPSKIRTNLKAPILVNPKLRLAKQTIFDNSDYPIQYFLAQAKQDSENKEVSHARSDA